MLRFHSMLFVLSVFLLPAVCCGDESLDKILVSKEFIYETAPFPECHASTVAETSDGALVCAWFGGQKEMPPMWRFGFRVERRGSKTGVIRS